MNEIVLDYADSFIFNQDPDLTNVKMFVRIRIYIYMAIK